MYIESEYIYGPVRSYTNLYALRVTIQKECTLFPLRCHPYYNTHLAIEALYMIPRVFFYAPNQSDPHHFSPTPEQ